MRKSGIMALELVGALVVGVLLLAVPQHAAAQDSWCAAFGSGAAWDAGSKTCTVSSPTAALTTDIVVGPEEKLVVTNDVAALTLSATITSYGDVAIWAFTTQSRGFYDNHGTLAVLGTFSNTGELVNHHIVRLYGELANAGLAHNHHLFYAATNSRIDNEGTFANLRKGIFLGTGEIANGGTFANACGAALTFDPGRFSGTPVAYEEGCDTAAPTADPALATGPNGERVVMWNWDDAGGSGIDPANCEAMTILRGEDAGGDDAGGDEEDTTVAAMCTDLHGNTGLATFTFGSGGGDGDGRGPTVTINQAADQADPTDVGPIRFTVVFSEPVSGFEANDVVLGGTAGATTAVISGGPTTYTVAIGGMAGSGTVTATVAAGAATDAAGRSSEASLSTDNTVTYTGAGVPPVCDGTHASVTIRLEADPAAETDVRFWGAYGSFQLDAPAADDGDSIFREITYNNVLGGTHTFAMSLPFGWSFGGVRCAGSGSCEEYNTQWDGARITVAACDNVTATFTALKQGTLAVTAFEDVDGNGEQGAGESGLGGWWSDLTMTQADGSQKLVASSFNDVTGTWYVVGLRPGEEYTVCQKPRAGWNNTLPGDSANDSRGWPCYTFTLASGEAADVSFGYSTAAVPPVAPEVASRGVKIRSAVDENTGYLFLPKVTAQ